MNDFDTNYEEGYDAEAEMVNQEYEDFIMTSADAEEVTDFVKLNAKLIDPSGQKQTKLLDPAGPITSKSVYSLIKWNGGEKRGSIEEIVAGIFEKRKPARKFKYRGRAS